MYQILIDYRTEGWKFDDRKFETVDLAVKTALEITYGNPFLIITVVPWEAKEYKLSL